MDSLFLALLRLLAISGLRLLARSPSSLRCWDTLEVSPHLFRPASILPAAPTTRPTGRICLRRPQELRSAFSAFMAVFMVVVAEWQ